MKFRNFFLENKELEEALKKLKLNMSNNYKDNAQADFKVFCERFEGLVKQGKLSEKKRLHYQAIREEYESKLMGFTHKDQKPYWTK